MQAGGFGPGHKQEDKAMAHSIYDIQGYTVVLDKIVFVTRVFKADDEEGFQFNIRFTGDLLLAPKFPSRHEADLQRELMLKAVREN
jgi:hypothetical protein